MMDDYVKIEKIGEGTMKTCSILESFQWMGALSRKEK